MVTKAAAAAVVRRRRDAGWRARSVVTPGAGTVVTVKGNFKFKDPRRRRLARLCCVDTRILEFAN